MFQVFFSNESYVIDRIFKLSIVGKKGIKALRIVKDHLHIQAAFFIYLFYQIQKLRTHILTNSSVLFMII